MKSYILIENAEFHAFHGVLAQETVVGNIFIVNLKFELDFIGAAKTDEIDDTVSYADVFELVREEMDTPAKLLESVAYRIISRLRSEYKGIGSIELKLSKRNPPIGASAKLDYASVLLIDDGE